MSNLTSSLTTDKKFLIFGCGFSGKFFAKTIRGIGCTALTSTRENCVPACLSCNGDKSDENALYWYRRQKFYDPRRAMEYLIL